MCVTPPSGRRSKEVSPEHSHKNMDDIAVTLENGDKSRCFRLVHPFKKCPFIVYSPPSGERSRADSWEQLKRNPVSTVSIIVDLMGGVVVVVVDTVGDDELVKFVDKAFWFCCVGR